MCSRKGGWLSMLRDSSDDPAVHRVNSPLPNSTVYPPPCPTTPHIVNEMQSTLWRATTLKPPTDEVHMKHVYSTILWEINSGHLVSIPLVKETNECHSTKLQFSCEFSDLKVQQYQPIPYICGLHVPNVLDQEVSYHNIHGLPVKGEVR